MLVTKKTTNCTTMGVTMVEGTEMINMPTRYWEPGIEETYQSYDEILGIENWIMENGIPYDEELPFN